jgi:hypothetical protein
MDRREKALRRACIFPEGCVPEHWRVLADFLDENGRYDEAAAARLDADCVECLARLWGLLEADHGDLGPPHCQDLHGVNLLLVPMTYPGRDTVVDCALLRPASDEDALWGFRRNTHVRTPPVKVGVFRYGLRHFREVLARRLVVTDILCLRRRVQKLRDYDRRDVVAYLRSCRTVCPDLEEVYEKMTRDDVRRWHALIDEYEKVNAEAE